MKIFRKSLRFPWGLFFLLTHCQDPSPSPTLRESMLALTSPTKPPNNPPSPPPPSSPTPLTTGDLGLPLILDPPDGAEGVVRDPLIRFSAPITQVSPFFIEGGGTTLRLVATEDPSILTLIEPAPPWTPLTLTYKGQRVLSFTTGADLRGDPIRIVALQPHLRSPIPPPMGIEFRFSQRLDPRIEVALEVTCNAEPQPYRFFLRHLGALGRIEPLYEWPQPATCEIRFAGFSLPPTGPIPFLISPISFTVLPPRGRVRISEIVVDPQSDWSDENGIPFDAVPGPGTPSSNDEYIEIVNASPEVVDLRGYRLDMLDGTDEVLVLDETTTRAKIRVIPEGSTIASLPPCGVVVIGDPPGQMNNEIFVRLVDPENNVVDFIHLTGSSSLNGLPQVYYNPRGGGNSNSPEDEAVFPLWVTGDGAPLIQGRATPGSAHCP